MRRLILAAAGVTTTFISLTSLITTDADGKKTWRSDQSNFLEFRLDDFLVERFHALVVAAGGIVTTPLGTPLAYGRAAKNFRVPAFIVWADPRKAAALKIRS